MMENYIITYDENGRTTFTRSDSDIHGAASLSDLNLTLLNDGWISFSRLGDPELLACHVYRKTDVPGGLFVMQAQSPLFIAHTDSNLVFSLACGYFAKIVENTRYAADIWEEMEGLDD